MSKENIATVAYNFQDRWQATGRCDIIIPDELLPPDV